jgi:hypothetical protein
MDKDDDYRKQAAYAQAWADRAIIPSTKRRGFGSHKVGCH